MCHLFHLYVLTWTVKLVSVSVTYFQLYIFLFIIICLLLVVCPTDSNLLRFAPYSLTHHVLAFWLLSRKIPIYYLLFILFCCFLFIVVMFAFSLTLCFVSHFNYYCFEWLMFVFVQLMFWVQQCYKTVWFVCYYHVKVISSHWIQCPIYINIYFHFYIVLTHCNSFLI